MPAQIHHLSIEETLAWFQAQNKTVVTLLGYSGMGYEDEVGLESTLRALFSEFDPQQTIINIGATAVGIGEAYALAKKLGFATTGVVSKVAIDQDEPLSPDCDEVFVIEDTTWGGINPVTQTLSPTSTAMVRCSSTIAAFGGNEVSRDEYQAAQALGIPVRFYPADMKHAYAIRRAKHKGLPEPTNFRGNLHNALNPTPPAQPGLDAAPLQAQARHNIVNRFVVWLAKQRWMARLLPKFAPHIDRWLFARTNGYATFTSLLAGTPAIALTTTGAKTGQLRTTPLLAIQDGQKLIIFATNFGQAHYPAWYHNLRAHPHCTVKLRGQTRAYRARPANPDETEQYWQEGYKLYEGYQNYRTWISGRSVPVMVLEPV